MSERNETIWLDENGNVGVSPLAEKLAQRNEQIKANLKNTYEKLKKEKETCRALKSKEKVGGQFVMPLVRAFRNYKMLTSQEVIDLDYDTIDTYWNAFLDIINYYVVDIDFLPTKQLFQRYMGINERIYKQLQNHSDSDIRDLMASIEEDIYAFACAGGESGNADGKATLNRLTMHGVGHGLIKETEKQALDKFGELPSNNEIDQEFNAVFGVAKKPKQLKK